jgi:hypothetical protein
MLRTIKRSSKPYLPATFARSLKRIGVYARYLRQAHNCRLGFQQHGDKYAQNVLFIAGLPKSGTTWLKKMVASYPGYHELLIPDVTSYELATGGSHDYELPEDIFSRFKNMLVVTKMHVHGSPHNVQLLHDAGVKYVTLYRDLRDVAVSYYFYVRRTPWHPEYHVYTDLDVSEGLEVFADRTLSAYRDWIYSWHQNRNPHMSLMFRYEDMLADTMAIMTKVAKHFDLDSSRPTVERIVGQHSFQNLSGGRTSGEESAQSFFRKGTSGDWKNYFSKELSVKYKRAIGDFLIEFGFEDDYAW